MGVKIIAHRGSNKKAPQNTLPAFRQAIAEGTDGFETDVHLTKDKQLVICHNYTINDTSDGRGDITSYTLAELKKFDFGSYFSREFANTQLPTLDEFLGLVGPADAEIINIEIKSQKDRSTEIVYHTLDEIKRHGVLDRIIISSFDPRVLKAVKAIEPRCKTAFLYPTNDPFVCRFIAVPFFIAKSAGVDILHPAAPMVNKSMVHLAHKLGYKVNVWTVNEPSTIRRLVACGVDGLITDCPGKTREYVEVCEGK
jgi:glycerophosphoryl diester phosphodiesterase